MTSNCSIRPPSCMRLQVITHNGLVIISDGACKVLAFELPETLPQPTTATRTTWQPVWSYSGSQSVVTAPDPECTTAVVTPGNHIIWCVLMTKRSEDKIRLEATASYGDGSQSIHASGVYDGYTGHQLWASRLRGPLT